MFKNIFPDHLNRLVYQNPPKGGAPRPQGQADSWPDYPDPNRRKEGEPFSATGKPDAKPKPDQKTAGEQAIERRLRGITVGDVTKRYVDATWEMITNGDINRFKHEDYLVLLRLLATERGKVSTLRPEETGSSSRSISDRLQLPISDMEEALEGTYEGYLVMDAWKEKETPDMTPEEHAVTLYELNKVPFAEAMSWYEGSTPNGELGPGRVNTFPRQMVMSRIYPKMKSARTSPNWRKERAHEVLWLTIDHFLKKAGGKEALKTRWVTMVQNPDYKPKNSEERSRQEFIRRMNFKPEEVTWQMVLRSEIDPADIVRSYKKTEEKSK